MEESRWSRGINCWIQP